VNLVVAIRVPSSVAGVSAVRDPSSAPQPGRYDWKVYLNLRGTPHLEPRRVGRSPDLECELSVLGEQYGATKWA
jgi:hypothetical protein